MRKKISKKQKEKTDRKIIKAFDIDKLKRCPYCSSTDIDSDVSMPEIESWKCNFCGEDWEE